MRTLCHFPSSLPITDLYLRFSAPKSFIKFHFRPSSSFKFQSAPPKPLSCDAVSMGDSSLLTSSDSSVDSVTNGLKKQSLEEDEVKRLTLEDLNWDHSFVRELPGDPRSDIIPREVGWFNSFRLFQILGRDLFLPLESY